MNCSEIQEQLADYLGGELEVSRRAALAAHLQMCDACRREVASLKETLRVMHRLEAPPQGVVVSPRSRNRARQPLAYAAMLLIGVGVGWVLKPAQEQESPQRVASHSTTMLASRLGMHPAWVEAVVGGSSASGGSDRFARNFVEFSRALSARWQR